MENIMRDMFVKWVMKLFVPMLFNNEFTICLYNIRTVLERISVSGNYADTSLQCQTFFAITINIC